LDRHADNETSNKDSHWLNLQANYQIQHSQANMQSANPLYT